MVAVMGDSSKGTSPAPPTPSLGDGEDAGREHELPPPPATALGTDASPPTESPVDSRSDLAGWLLVALGGLVGAVAGAGVMLALFHQPTATNIESGFALQSLEEWIKLAVDGALLGLLVGAVCGFLTAKWRPAGVLLVVLTVGGAVGWVIVDSREAIDCEDQTQYCLERYR